MDPDLLGRTTKLELDEGRADSPEGAAELVATYRVGVTASAGFERTRTSTAAVLTAITTARRAFPGGVWLAAEGDPIVTHGWGRGRRLSAIAADVGVVFGPSVPETIPHTIAIGEPLDSRPTLHATWHGWAGGVVLTASERAAEDDVQPLAGVLSAGLAVSEAFQAVRGFVLAGRRVVGMSLWRPDLDWRTRESLGPSLEYLPTKLWLLGLGHLGQAYAWSIASLPYERPGELLIGLVDPQYVVPANVDTGLLSTAASAGRRKARIVAAGLESIGIVTSVVERSFNEAFHPGKDEPSVALAGFDDPAPRRLLDEAGFVRSIDIGLGAGSPQYLEGLIHAFPSGIHSRDAFAADADVVAVEDDPRLDRPAYRAEIERLKASGLSERAARCGVIEVAGRTAGAAFVGAVASTLAITEELRALAGGPRYEVLGVSLRSGLIQAVANRSPGSPSNPGCVRAAKA